MSVWSLAWTMIGFARRSTTVSGMRKVNGGLTYYSLKSSRHAVRGVIRWSSPATPHRSLLKSGETRGHKPWGMGEACIPDVDVLKSYQSRGISYSDIWFERGFTALWKDSMKSQRIWRRCSSLEDDWDVAYGTPYHEQVLTKEWSESRGTTWVNVPRDTCIDFETEITAVSLCFLQVTFYTFLLE